MQNVEISIFVSFPPHPPHRDAFVEDRASSPRRHRATLDGGGIIVSIARRVAVVAHRAGAVVRSRHL